MPRLFIALDLPEDIRDGLFGLGSSIPGSRFVPHEQIHLTLKFMGDIESSRLQLLMEALAEIQHNQFDLTLSGVGHFPPRGKPTVLWIGTKPCESLILLQKRIENILYHRGFAREDRKFFPHVTVARLQNSPAGRVGQFLAGNSLLTSPEFIVSTFSLYASSLTSKGAIHTIQQSFPLQEKMNK